MLAAGDDHDDEAINYVITSNFNSDTLNGPIIADEVQRCIRKLKSNKSPGVDSIINGYIKCTEDLWFPLYVKLFNKILDTGVFPSEWSIGAIMLLYKNKGNPKDTNNYRGVTLLSCAGKLFTSVLNDRLNQYSEAHSLINETQPGFRHEYSTLDHGFLLKCIVDLFQWKKRKLFCLFVDYKKSF